MENNNTLFLNKIIKNFKNNKSNCKIIYYFHNKEK